MLLKDGTKAIVITQSTIFCKSILPPEFSISLRLSAVNVSKYNNLTFFL